MRFAFKEWAVIAEALAMGRQAIILRKGGIAEVGGEFRPEHDRFWIYPTYVHQQETGIKPSAVSLLEQVRAARPPAGIVRLSHYGEVAGVFDVRRPDLLESIDPMHLWSPETIRSRFEYRRPGIFLLPVRVYRAERPLERIETEAFAGCKSWVDLGEDVPVAGSVPVLGDREFGDVLDVLHRVLNPVSMA
jgi:hypothetical protein